jgi:hypothetical protein
VYEIPVKTALTGGGAKFNFKASPVMPVTLYLQNVSPDTPVWVQFRETTTEPTATTAHLRLKADMTDPISLQGNGINSIVVSLDSVCVFRTSSQ